MTARILVVDDEPDVEALVLQKFRHQIRDNKLMFLFAQDGVEALKLLDSNRDIDLVISDINMPKMDGITLIRALRIGARPIAPLPVLVISTEARKQDRDDARAAGANFYLVKPVSEGALLRYVAVLAGVAGIALGWDTGALARVSLTSGAGPTSLEQRLVHRVRPPEAAPAMQSSAGMSAAASGDQAGMASTVMMRAPAMMAQGRGTAIALPSPFSHRLPKGGKQSRLLPRHARLSHFVPDDLAGGAGRIRGDGQSAARHHADRQYLRHIGSLPSILLPYNHNQSSPS